MNNTASKTRLMNKTILTTMMTQVMKMSSIIPDSSYCLPAMAVEG
jgi:hypothetical protein